SLGLPEEFVAVHFALAQEPQDEHAAGAGGKFAIVLHADLTLGSKEAYLAPKGQPAATRASTVLNLPLAPTHRKWPATGRATPRSDGLSCHFQGGPTSMIPRRIAGAELRRMLATVEATIV